MHVQVLLLVVGVGVAVADQGPYSYSAPQTSEKSADARSDFNWVVQDEDFGQSFGHQEASEGDITQGSYSVLLPDGRLQTVTYYVDGDSGFMAEVSYQGEARSAESQDPPQRSAPTQAPQRFAPTQAPRRFAPTQAPQQYVPPQPTYAAPRETYGYPNRK